MALSISLYPKPVQQGTYGSDNEPVLGSGYELRDDVSGLPYAAGDPTLQQQNVLTSGVTGMESFGNALRNPAFEPGRTVAVVPDPDGRVGVWDREQLMQVGWLPADTAEALQRLRSQGLQQHAVVLHEWRRHDGTRVGLDVALSPEPLRIAGQVPAAAPAPAPAPPPAQSSGPNWGLIVGIIVAIALLVVLVLFIANRDTDDEEPTTTTTTSLTTTSTTTTTTTTTAPTTTTTSTTTSTTQGGGGSGGGAPGSG